MRVVSTLGKDNVNSYALSRREVAIPISLEADVPFSARVLNNKSHPLKLIWITALRVYIS